MADSTSRARAAVLGGVAADAATVGVHWIYDTSKILQLAAEAAKEGKTVAFHDPPACPFYKAAVGASSPWMHETIPLLQLAARSKDVDAGAYAAACRQYYKDNAAAIPYTNKALRDAFAAVDAGTPWQQAATPDTQGHGMCKAPVVVAMYHGQGDVLAAKAEEFCRVHQTSQDAVDFAVGSAKVLDRLVAGATVKDTLEWAATPGNLPAVVTAAVSAALDLRNDGFTPAVQTLGSSCAYPGTFSASILALAKADDENNSFEQSIEHNMLAGGDNACRAIFIGACLAAANGLDSVPEEWTRKTSFYAEAEQLIDQALA